MLWFFLLIFDVDPLTLNILRFRGVSQVLNFYQSLLLAEILDLPGKHKCLSPVCIFIPNCNSSLSKLWLCTASIPRVEQWVKHCWSDPVASIIDYHRLWTVCITIIFPFSAFKTVIVPGKWSLLSREAWSTPVFVHPHISLVGLAGLPEKPVAMFHGFSRKPAWFCGSQLSPLGSLGP